MNIYEMYGRKAEEVEELGNGLRETLTLLEQLKSGQVRVEQMEVSDHGWSLIPVNGHSDQPIPEFDEIPN